MITRCVPGPDRLGELLELRHGRTARAPPALKIHRPADLAPIAQA
jgi:hypothetical protein